VDEEQARRINEAAEKLRSRPPRDVARRLDREDAARWKKSSGRRGPGGLKERGEA
jgi:hypothetical protein